MNSVIYVIYKKLIMKKIKLDKKYINIFKASEFPFENGANSKSISRWMIMFSSAIQQYKRISYNCSNKDKSGNGDCYFALITPFVKAASIELLSLPNVYYLSLDYKCRVQLENQLAKKLIYICSPTIDSLYENLQSEISIDEYVEQLYKKPLVFFKEYSVLARLLSMHARYWVKSTSKLIKRLLNDFSQFDRLLFDSSNSIEGENIVKAISEFQLGLSDPHDKGQMVVIIGFKNGEKIVYKPKSVMAEYGFCKFVDWVNNQLESQLKLLCVPVLDKGDYGWAKYIQYKSCKNDEEICRFYTRVGMLSAILYVARGMDYHHDNLIVNGEYPLFIDHEMMFYPIYIDPENKSLINKAISEVQAGYYESVINTRIFPISEKRINGDVADISAVGYCSNSETNQHLPVNNCALHDPVKYKSNITDGFQKVYEILMNNKDLFLTDESPLSYLKQSDFRFNVRATSSYLSINNLCIMPEALKTGVGFCNKIHAIRVKIQSIFRNGLPLDLRLEELKVLSRLDVPRFTVKSFDKCLSSTAGKTFNDVLNFSGNELVEQRIKDLSEIDMLKQVQYIEKALSS